MTDLSGRLRRDEVLDLLRAQIIGGALPPGTRIREERIAADHGVSRVPVREALQRLEHEGYLILAPRRGATVATPSPARALEVMVVRRSLEVLAARLAAARRGGEVAGDLQSLVARADVAVGEHRHEELPVLIDRFHELVAVASGNAELVALLAQLRPRVKWMFEFDLENRSVTAWHDHAEILGAISAGQGDRAACLMDSHVERDELDFREQAKVPPA